MSGAYGDYEKAKIEDMALLVEDGQSYFVHHSMILMDGYRY